MPVKRIIPGGSTVDASLSGSYEPSGVPVNGDTVIITDGDFQLTNIGTAWSGLTLNQLIVQPGARVTADATISATFTTGTGPGVILRGDGGHLEFSGNITQMFISGGMTATVSGGTLARLVAENNQLVTVTSGAVLTRFYGVNPAAVLGSNATPITQFEQSGGRVETQRNMQNGNLAGRGRVVFIEGATVSASNNGELVACGGAVVEFRAQAGGVYADKITFLDASFTDSQSKGPVTITTGFVSASARVPRTNAFGTTLITNLTALGPDGLSLGFGEN
jgi:hypothetical protein